MAMGHMRLEIRNWHTHVSYAFGNSELAYTWVICVWKLGNGIHMGHMRLEIRNWHTYGSVAFGN